MEANPAVALEPAAESMPVLSFLEIDVGFDLRLHPGMAIIWPSDMAPPLVLKFDGRNGEERRVCRTEAEAKGLLRAAGYTVTDRSGNHV
jgi:hypothetical protein